MVMEELFAFVQRQFLALRGPILVGNISTLLPSSLNSDNDDKELMLSWSSDKLQQTSKFSICKDVKPLKMSK